MREMKFRAWAKNQGMKYFLNDIPGEYLPIIVIGINPTVYGVSGMEHPVEIMQYTSLKDKNGKDIYEGDLVRFDFEDDPELGHIFWREELASFEWQSLVDNDHSPFRAGMIEQDRREILGNIYQNPELMGKK